MGKFRFLAVLLATLLVSGQALAEKRVALVIGNGEYPKIGVLPNPPNDAKLMAESLRKLDFDVIERIDVDQKGMKRAIKAFGQKLADSGKDAVGLFYYAGHGVQVGGVNYLIPVNVDIESEADIDIEAVAADAVQAQMAYSGNRLNIIILDACRNNPFKRSFRSASRGLAKMDASKGTLIAYATSPGDVAADGSGSNSPYTRALASAMLVPGQSVERVFKQVRNSVVTITKSKQVPWEASSLVGADFYFTPPSLDKNGKPAAVDMEVMFWQSIKDSDAPEDFQVYLEQYENGVFTGLAQSKIRSLHKAKSQQQVASLPLATGPVKFVQGTFAPHIISADRECKKVLFDDVQSTSDGIKGKWSHPYAFGTLEVQLEDGLILARMRGTKITGYHETAQIRGNDLFVKLELRHRAGSCKLVFQLDGVVTQ